MSRAMSMSLLDMSLQIEPDVVLFAVPTDRHSIETVSHDLGCTE